MQVKIERRSKVATKTIAGHTYHVWMVVDYKRMANTIASNLKKDKGHTGTGKVPKSVRVVKGKSGYVVCYR
jgi:hypothetical protein